MRRGVFVAGVVLLVVGLLVIVAGTVVNGGTRTQKIPVGGIEFRPTALTADSIHISWSKVASTVKVYVISGSPTCSNPTGVAGSGSGINGSFTAVLDPGQTYSIYACSGTAFVVITISYTISPGITIGDLLGGAGIVGGVLLLFVSRRGPRRARTVEDPFVRGVLSGHYRSDEGDDPTRDPSGTTGGFPRRRRGGARIYRSGRPDPLLPTSSRAAGLSGSSRGPVRRASTPHELRPRPVEVCPSCSRVYTRGRHAACPACGAALSIVPADRATTPAEQVTADLPGSAATADAEDSSSVSGPSSRAP